MLRFGDFRNRLWTMKYIKLKIFLIVILSFCTNSLAQEKDFSQIVVHIWGEVKSPGEYRVSDGIDVLDIISKAGGPTEFARLSKVRLTRALNNQQPGSQNDGELTSVNSYRKQYRNLKRVVLIDVSHYLKQTQRVYSLPTLQSGDIVYVPKNRWSTWKAVATIIRDVAIVANAYYWLQRSN